MSFKGKFSTFFSEEILQKTTIPMEELAILLSEKSGEKIPYSTIDNWKRGEGYFPPDLIPHFISITKERDSVIHERLLNFLFKDSGYCVCEHWRQRAVNKALDKVGVELIGKSFEMLKLLTSKEADIDTTEFLLANREPLIAMTQKIIRLSSSIKDRVLNGSEL